MSTSPTASSANANELSGKILQGVHYIKLPATVTDATLPPMIDIFKNWSALKVDMHVIDFGKLTSAPIGFYRLLQTFEVQLKQNGLKMLSINMDEAVTDQIHQMSLQQTFNQTREAAKVDPTKKFGDAKSKKLLFKYLVNAAYEAVTITLQSTVSCDENYFSKAEALPLNEIDLISVVPVNNEFMKAEFRLCSSVKVLERFAHAMLGKDQAIDADLLESMALELLNMIYGHAKSNLNDKEKFRLPSAIPRIVRKNDLGRIKRSVPPELTIMPMVTPMGSFYIEIDFGSLT